MAIVYLAGGASSLGNQRPAKATQRAHHVIGQMLIDQPADQLAERTRIRGFLVSAGLYSDGLAHCVTGRKLIESKQALYK